MKYYIALGSNIGEREKYLREALKELKKIGTVIKVSSIYESEPFGFKNQLYFLNAVCILEFDGDAFQLLEKLKFLENKMGRKKNIHWGPRIIDLDIIDYEGEPFETEELAVPHPHMDERLFVLIPLAEIEPEYRERGGRSIKEMIESCTYAHIQCYSEQW